MQTIFDSEIRSGAKVKIDWVPGRNGAAVEVVVIPRSAWGRKDDITVAQKKLIQRFYNTVASLEVLGSKNDNAEQKIERYRK